MWVAPHEYWLHFPALVVAFSARPTLLPCGCYHLRALFARSLGGHLSSRM